MTIPQQFSLRWNNYSQHIVSALEDLRSDDEFTDVTLSCEGERLKAHKILLSACSTYFRDTFRENPCKHPVIILKGVIFTDLQAVVRFMYNGQVNVSQERLPSFLQTAELLQIKGLTDMNEKEDTAKKRNGSASTSSQNLPSNVDSNSRSATPDVPPRPPTPKRKRIIVGGYPNDGASSSGNISFSSSSAVSTQPIVVASSSNGPSTSGGGLLNPQSVVIPSTSSIQVNEEEFQDVSIVKYEDDDTQEQEDEYEEKHMSSDNDNSAHDMLCNVEPGSIGVFGGNGPSGMNATGVESSSHGSRVLRSRSRSEFMVDPHRQSINPMLAIAHHLTSSISTGQPNTLTLAGHGHLNFKMEPPPLIDISAASFGSDPLSIESFPPPESQILGLDHNQDSGSGKRKKNMGTLKPGYKKKLVRRRPYICRTCGKSYTHATSLANHVKIHLGQTICHICDVTFATVSILRGHLQHHHGMTQVEAFNACLTRPLICGD